LQEADRSIFVKESAPNPEHLSARERQIAKAYAAGQSYRQIAERLFIAPTTVRTHLGTIYRKLGVSSKIELQDALAGRAANVSEKREDADLVAELALELDETHRREKALATVLAIISRSRGRIETVIASVLDYALDLCEAEFGILFEFEADGRFRATHSRGIPAPFEEWLTEQGRFRVSPDTGLGRVENMLMPVNIADVRLEEIYRRGDPLRYATADLGGARSFAAIPMIFGERLVGAFTVYRQRVHPFDNRSLELAQMFADQSAIAIENARLIEIVRRHES
jgi:DNA-binding CsgD family transcriptional regulator/transcriptional regulator with GAF, ATPase, and Fis domain